MTKQQIGRYRILRELGRGGMAVVYLAEDPRFKRRVALKILPVQLTTQPQFHARFKREAEVIASLEHAAIVPVHDYGEDEGQPYLVMRYMPGGSLRERLSDGRLSLPASLEILERIAPALDKAHKRGIVHRDLKPENILFDEEGQPFISDFGIAKITQSKTALTQTGILGTPAYMSPEQATEKARLDGRSDQYSLGVILYEMLSGKTVFNAKTPVAMLVAHANQKPPAITAQVKSLPVELDAVLDKALAKHPQDRYKTIRDFANAARQTLDGFAASPARSSSNPVEAPRTQLLKQQRLPRRHSAPQGSVVRQPKWITLGLAVILLIALVFIWRQINRPEPVVNEDPPLSEAVTPTARATAPATSPTENAPQVEAISSQNVEQLSELRGWDAGGGFTFYSIAFSPNGELLASSSASRSIKLWNVEDGALLKTLDAHISRVIDVSFSPNGELLASGSADQTAMLWQVEDGLLFKTLYLSGEVTSVAFSPDGEVLATAAAHKVSLWDVQTGNLIGTLGHDQVHTVVFSPDGKFILSASSSIRIWDAQSHTLVNTLRGHSALITDLDFSSDGAFIASASFDETVKFWNLDGTLLRSVAIGLPVYEVALSNDGQLFVPGVGAGLEVWDVYTGEVLYSLEAGAETVVEFNPRGDILASGTIYGGWLQLWNIP